MTKQSLCDECGNGLVIDDFIMYLKQCEKCGKVRMCQNMVIEDDTRESNNAS